MKKLFLVFLVLGLIGCEGQSPEEFQKLQNDIFNKIVSLPDNQACKKISEFEAWMKTIDARSKQDSTYWRVVAENYNIASKEASSSDLKYLCSIEEVKNKSLTRLEFTKDHEQIIFHCPKPKMINEKTWGNEATYIITGYRGSPRGDRWVFGSPSNPYRYIDDFYIKLSKEKGSDSFQHYDFYIINKDKIYLHSGELTEDLSHYSLYSPSLRSRNYSLGHRWSLARANFELESSQSERVERNHHIVGDYYVDWSFDLATKCMRKNTEKNVHQVLFDLVEKTHVQILKEQEILRQKKEKAQKSSIERQKKENKI